VVLAAAGVLCGFGRIVAAVGGLLLLVFWTIFWGVVVLLFGPILFGFLRSFCCCSAVGWGVFLCAGPGSVLAAF
jgi:hypothetical protein